MMGAHLISGIGWAFCAGGFVDSLVVAKRWKYAVRGTHERYVFTSVRRITMWFSYASGVLWTVADILDRELFFAGVLAVLSAFNFFITLRLWRRMRDEDDWWKRTGKRLRRGLRNLGRSVSLRPASTLA